MEININTLSPVEQEANITLPHEELLPHFDKAYESYRAKAALKGFRKGKAPLGLIKKMYGTAIEQEALDEIANEAFQEVIRERNIQPLGRPSMTNVDFQPGKHFQFSIKFEVRPAVELTAYKGIAVDKPVHHITEAEIDDEVMRLRRTNSTTEEALEVTDDEYAVTADVQELDDAGTPLIGRTSAGVRFPLYEEGLMQDIKDALRYAKTGETYKASYENRHDDHVHKTNVALTVTRVEKVLLPAFDEAFVKKVSQDRFASPGEFRNYIREEIERYWVETSTSRLRDNIAEEIVRRHDIQVPNALVEAFLDSFVEDVRNRAKDRRLPAGFNEQKFREERRVYATWQTRWMLLRERIAEVEAISVTEDDIRAMAEEDARKTGLEVDKLLPYYTESSRMKDRLLTDKVMAFLIQHATITEKEASGS